MVRDGVAHELDVEHGREAQRDPERVLEEESGPFPVRGAGRVLGAEVEGALVADLEREGGPADVVNLAFLYVFQL
jgi:hypothetical protein